ncbi:ParB/RepB/Spo0J family partition protein [Nocardia salmonicida]|uniref:ParB/RepB/Spo0J family partition protein n=1 Tax=Nocardia salmonicida TaxID=53431 RepID=UPI0037B98BD2
MTSTTETTPAETRPAPDLAPHADGETMIPSAERELLKDVDPHTLDIGRNVREIKEHAAATVEDWPGFVADIAANGVQHPILVARRTSDGALQVIDGQLRTLAAREADRTVSALVVAVDISELERITLQYRSNKRRHDMSAEDEAKAIQDVLDLGITPTKAAKRLSVNVAEVKAVQALGSSATARALLGDGQMSLTEAAAAAEFSDDEAATVRLVAAAGRGNFAHTLAQVRAARDAQAARAAVLAEHQARGFELLDEEVFYAEYDRLTPLHLLRADPDRRAVTAEDIKNPANWSVHFNEKERVTLAETGKAVGEWDVDWRTSNDPYAVASKGKHHAAEVRVETVLTPSYYCRDAAAEGLRSIAGKSQSKDAEAIAAEKATKAAESRRSTLCNELARAATGVRREWVSENVLGKTLPAGALVWAARVLADSPGIISENAAAPLAQQLAGPKGYTWGADKPRGKAAADRARDCAQVVVVAMAVGAVEARMQPNEGTPHYWRGGTMTAGANPERRRGLISDYLALLSEWGYTPARIEAVALGTADVDEVAAEAAEAKAAARAAAKKAAAKK